MFKDRTWQEKLLIVAGALMVMALILKDQLIPPFILLFGLSTIPFWKGEKEVKLKKVVFPMIVLFVLYAVSFLFVVNKSQGILQLTTRLSFLIFPVLAILMSRGLKPARLGLKWGFILGSGISMLFSFFRAVFTEGGFSGDAFQSNVYGVNMHASYLALIFLFACALLFMDKSNSKLIKISKWAFLGLTVVSLFYLRSLGAFVCVAAIFTAVPIWKALKTRNWKWLLTLPLYGLIFFLGLKSSPKISNDVEASLTSMSVWSESPSQFIKNNVNNIESNTVRLVVWTVSTNMIVANPFGVGLGDESDLLMREYYKHGYSGYAERRLNPHQQFLQTGISIGWLGIITLFVLFISLIIASFRTGDLALFIGAICISVSCLFESMLERQVGVIFLSMLVFYIAIVRFDQLKKKPSE
ncbi:MAG: O-antigen ligase family protein [Crocinitomicaceae bacterium]|nr:O-antigen ligase family protein [Crocinitomicaceae bacterium]